MGIWYVSSDSDIIRPDQAIGYSEVEKADGATGGELPVDHYSGFDLHTMDPVDRCSGPDGLTVQPDCLHNGLSRAFAKLPLGHDPAVNSLNKGPGGYGRW